MIVLAEFHILVTQLFTLCAPQNRPRQAYPRVADTAPTTYPIPHRASVAHSPATRRCRCNWRIPASSSRLTTQSARTPLIRPAIVFDAPTAAAGGYLCFYPFSDLLCRGAAEANRGADKGQDFKQKHTHSHFLCVVGVCGGVWSSSSSSNWCFYIALILTEVVRFAH